MHKKYCAIKCAIKNVLVTYVNNRMSINWIKSVIASKAGKGWAMLCKLSLPIVQEGI